VFFGFDFSLSADIHLRKASKRDMECIGEVNMILSMKYSGQWRVSGEEIHLILTGTVYNEM